MKNRIPIIAAIIMGVVVVMGIQRYVARIQQEAAERLKGSPVVAAAVDIPAGTEIAEGSLMTIPVPPRYIVRQAMTTKSEMRQVEGRKTRVDVRKGDILLWADLELEKPGGLSSLIPKGERAFSIAIGSGINQELLQLNDRVDIVGIFAEPQETGLIGQQTGFAGEETTACVVLLQAVNILALGTTMGDGYTDPSGPAAGGGDATFSVSLQEAQLLMYASQYGDLAMALRREGEVEFFDRAELPRITMAELEAKTGELDTKRKRQIQVMRGAAVETIEVDSRSGGTDMGTFE